MNSYPQLRFGVIGIDHRHIFDQVQSLLDIGAECAGYYQCGSAVTEEGFTKRFPQIPRTLDKRQLLEDESIQLIISAAIPCDRADIAIEAMRHNKDVMVDKPGVISFEQLDRVMKTQQETQRIYSVNFTEHFEVRAVSTATDLIKKGEIGEVLHTLGVGPHRLNIATRPEWFFRPEAYGGILVDIASHQIEQFLHFTGADDAEIVSARFDNLNHPQYPGLQDFGEIVLRHGKLGGYIRVDWFTPDGLDTWGDGRLTIMGTDGYIEIRKYIDISGRPGKEHLFMVNNKGSFYFDCSKADLPYYTDLASDIFNRTETAMSQKYCFKVCELALKAQQVAIRYVNVEK